MGTVGQHNYQYKCFSSFSVQWSEICSIFKSTNSLITNFEHPIKPNVPVGVGVRHPDITPGGGGGDGHPCNMEPHAGI